MRDLVVYIHQKLSEGDPEEAFRKAASLLPWLLNGRRERLFQSVYQEFHHSHPWELLSFVEQVLRRRHSNEIALVGAKLARRLGDHSRAAQLFKSVKLRRLPRRSYLSELVKSVVSDDCSGEVKGLAGLLSELSNIEIAAPWETPEKLELLREAVRSRSLALVRKGCLKEAIKLLQQSLEALRSDLCSQRQRAHGEVIGLFEQLLEEIQSSCHWLKAGLQPVAAQASKGTGQGVLYLTFCNMPFRRNGNSVRTHGLLSSLVAEGWPVHCLTRPGFGAGERAMEREGIVMDEPAYPCSSSYVWGSVRYTNLTPPGAKSWWLNYESHFRFWLQGVLDVASHCRPAILHGASNFIIGAATVRAAEMLGLPSIYEVRGLRELDLAADNPSFETSEECQWMRKLELEVAQSATHLFAISSLVAEELTRRGVPGKKITVLPNAVDPQLWHPSPPDQELLEEHGLAESVIIGFVGTVSRYEGLELLLEALAMLVAEGTNAKLVVVGDGPHLGEIFRQVDHLGLGAHFVHVPPVRFEKVHRYYALFDLVVLPRLPMAICELVTPIKPYEAMALAKAVIASDVEAFKLIVRDGFTGLLFEKGNARSLASTLRRAIGDPALRERLGAAARQFVLQHHSWPEVVRNRVLPVYEALTCSKPSKAYV